jgi:hypothetical protein
MPLEKQLDTVIGGLVSIKVLEAGAKMIDKSMPKKKGKKKKSYTVPKKKIYDW